MTLSEARRAAIEEAARESARRSLLDDDGNLWFGGYVAGAVAEAERAEALVKDAGIALYAIQWGFGNREGCPLCLYPAQTPHREDCFIGRTLAALAPYREAEA